MTETVSHEVVMSSAPAAAEEKIVERKTIVYETRTDPAVIKLAAEKLKDQLFTKFGFLKPKPEDVRFVSIEKCYETYVLVTGCYSIDYYRKCQHDVEIDKDVVEIILLDRTFKPEQRNDPRYGNYNAVMLQGEERLINEEKCSLILDKQGHEVTTEKLPSAPSERHPERVLKEYGIEELTEDADVEMMRTRLIRSPAEVSRVVSEIFEVSERTIIYTPRFKVTYANAKTGEEKTLEFDGVTAQKIGETRRSLPRNDASDLPPPPPPP